MIRQPPRQGYDEFKPFKLVGVNRVRLWAWPKSQLYRSGIGIIPSGTVVVFVVIRGRSLAFVLNRVITDTGFWYKNRGIIAEKSFSKVNLS